MIQKSINDWEKTLALYGLSEEEADKFIDLLFKITPTEDCFKSANFNMSTAEVAYDGGICFSEALTLLKVTMKYPYQEWSTFRHFSKYSLEDLQKHCPLWTTEWTEIVKNYPRFDPYSTDTFAAYLNRLCTALLGVNIKESYELYPLTWGQIYRILSNLVW